MATAKKKTTKKPAAKKKATSKKKAPVKKKVATKKPAVKKKVAKKTATKKVPAKKKATGLTTTDQVLKVIKRFKKGVGVPTIKERTGLGDSVVRNIVYKACKSKIIKRVSRGVYAGT